MGDYYGSPPSLDLWLPFVIDGQVSCRDNALVVHVSRDAIHEARPRCRRLRCLPIDSVDDDCVDWAIVHSASIIVQSHFRTPIFRDGF